MNTQRKANVLKVLTVLAIFAMLFGVATPVFAESNQYPLAGATYPAQNFSGTALQAYNPVWTADGRLWQPNLPAGPQRVAFAVSVEIVSGTYVGNAVACDYYLDEARNGKGSQNKQVLNHENGKEFKVDAKEGGNAWLLVQCDGGVSSGFEIWATNPSYTGVTDSQPTQSVVEPTAQPTSIPTQMAPATPAVEPTPMPASGAPVTIVVDPGFATFAGYFGFSVLACCVPLGVLALIAYAIAAIIRSSRKTAEKKTE